MGGWGGHIVQVDHYIGLLAHYYSALEGLMVAGPGKKELMGGVKQGVVGQNTRQKAEVKCGTPQPKSSASLFGGGHKGTKGAQEKQLMSDVPVSEPVLELRQCWLNTTNIPKVLATLTEFFCHMN